VGSAVIKKLLEDGSFIVTAVVRHTSTGRDTSIPNVQYRTANFESQDSLTEALQNQNAVICAIPSPAVKLSSQKLIIEAAIKAGVSLYFADEFVSNILNPGFGLFPTEFVGEKIEVRKYLEQKASNGEIAFTALNGGPFFDMCQLSELGF
jgi:putative NADH-flavin reductase